MPGVPGVAGTAITGATTDTGITRTTTDTGINRAGCVTASTAATGATALVPNRDRPPPGGGGRSPCRSELLGVHGAGSVGTGAAAGKTTETAGSADSDTVATVGHGITAVATVASG